MKIVTPSLNRIAANLQTETPDESATLPIEPVGLPVTHGHYSNPTLNTVSLCMIVKKQDQLDTIACIEPVAHFFHDIVIVVDRGGSECLSELRERFSTKIVEFGWEDSFAAARNAATRHAKGDWIFWLDSDERIDKENQAKLQRLFASLTNNNDAFFMAILSEPDDLHGCSFVTDHIRLYRNDSAHIWKYRVHEQILPALRCTGTRLLQSNIVIHHFGYCHSLVNAEKRKRNLRLLRMDATAFPGDLYVLFNIGNTLFDDGAWTEALPLLTACLTNAPSDSAYIAKAHLLLVKIHANMGRYDDAMQICQKGQKQFPGDPDLLFEEGNIFLHRGDTQAAHRAFNDVLRAKTKGVAVGSNVDLVHHARHNLAVICRNQGNHREAEVHWLRIIDTFPSFGPAWLGLAEIYLSQQRKGDLAKLNDRLMSIPGIEPVVSGIQARTALRKTNWCQSTQILEDAVVRFPNATWLRLLLADIFLRVAEDRRSAEQQLGQILAIDPNHSVAREKLRAISDSQ